MFNYILIIILGVMLYIYFRKLEHFDKDGTIFLPTGEQRYDLRGYPLVNHPIYDCRHDKYHDCYNSRL